MFPRLDFAYDAARDIYICPNGRPLRTSGTVHERLRRLRVVSVRRFGTRSALSRSSRPAIRFTSLPQHNSSMA